MKRYALYLVALALAASMQAAAQGTTSTHSSISENRLVRAEKNYLACLSSENAGLMESGMAHIVRLKMLYPGRELTGLRKRLEELAVNSPLASIRYKAYLAASVLDNPALVAPIRRVESMTNDELFAAIAERLQETLLGYSVR